jgi:hypothetical protein
MAKKFKKEELMSEATKVQVEAITTSILQNKTIGGISYLWQRWADEKEYEDWREYIKAMKATFESDATVTQAKAMFDSFVNYINGGVALFFNIATYQIRIYITASGKCGWERIK